MATFHLTDQSGAVYEVDAPDENAAVGALGALHGSASPAAVATSAQSAAQSPLGGAIPAAADVVAKQGDPRPSIGQEGSAVASNIANGLRAVDIGIPLSGQIEAGVKSLVGGGDYSKNLADEQAARAGLSQQHPVLSAVGNAIGTVATGAALPLGAAAEGAGLLGKIGHGVMTGGAAGGVQGLSNSPDWTDIGRTAKDTAEGMGLGAVFGGAVPLAGSGFNAVRNFFANPEGAIVSRALQGVDDATLARAQALMEDAQRRGITLTSAEAVQQASNGASGLGRLQRLTEGTTGGSVVLSPVMANRPGQVSDAFNAVLDKIVPAATQPSMIGVRGQAAAGGAIDTVRRGINTATEPLYAAAGSQTLSPTDFAPIANDPAFRASLARLRADPVLGPTYAGQPDNSIRVIDAVSKDMGARGQALSNAANPGFQPEAAAMYSRGAGEARDIARDPNRGGNADYDTALLMQARGRQDNLAPLEAGPLGKMANTADTGTHANALFPSKPLEGAAAETADAIGRLNKIDPELAQNLVRQHLATNFADANSAGVPGANQWGGAKFAAQVAGNPLQEQTLMHGLAALPNGATVAPDVTAIMPVLRATGKRQGPGSLTAQNTLDLKEMAAPSGLGAMGESLINPLSVLPHIYDAVTRARLESRSGDIAKAMVSDPVSAIDWLRGAQERAAPVQVPAALSPIAALFAAQYGAH